MIHKLFAVVATLIVPLVFAAAVVLGQTPTTNPTQNTTDNMTTNNTTTDDTDDFGDDSVPTGAPRTGLGGAY